MGTLKTMMAKMAITIMEKLKMPTNDESISEKI